MSRLFKGLFIFVASIIATLALGTIASAEIFPAEFSTEPAGTVLYSWDDTVNGKSAYDLVRVSMLDDISNSMDSLIDYVKVHASTDTPVDFYSAVASQTSYGGYDYEGSAAESLCVYMPIWGDLLVSQWGGLVAQNTSVSNLKDAFDDNKLWSSYFTTDNKKNTKEVRLYLNFYSSGKYYSLKLTNEADASSFNKMSLISAPSSFKNKKFSNLHTLYCAYLESWAPYMSVIYSINGTSTAPIPISSINTDTISSENNYIEYIIHPVLGIVPCAHKAKNSVYFANATEDIYFDEIADIISAYIIGAWMDDSDTIVKASDLFEEYEPTLAVLLSSFSGEYESTGETYTLGYTYIYPPDYDALAGSKNDGYFNFIGKTNGLSDMLVSSYPFFFTMFPVNKDVAYNSDVLTVHADNLPECVRLSYDYITWLRLKNTPDLSTVVVPTDAPRSMQPLTVFSYTENGVSHDATPDSFLHVLLPIVYPSEWFNTNVYGIYSIFNTTADVTCSSLSAFELTKEGDITYKIPENYAKFDGLKLLYGSLSGFGASDTDYETYFVSCEDSDVIFKLTLNSTSDITYYYNYNDGYIYANTPHKADTSTQFAVFCHNMNTGLSSPFNSGQLLSNYMRILEGTPSDYYIYSAQIAESAGKFEKVTLSADTCVYTSTHMHLVLIPSAYYECISDIWKTKRSLALGGATSDISVPFYVNTGRKVYFNFKNTTSLDLVSKNQAVRYDTDGSVGASGMYYNNTGLLKSGSTDALTYTCRMTKDGPSIILHPAYYTESGVLNWLQTDTANEFMANRVQQTGYTASTLYSRLISKGVTISGGIADDDLDRLISIEDELGDIKANQFSTNMFTIVAFLGILIIVYSVALLVAYFIDVFNTFVDIQLLKILTFGGFTAVATKQDMDTLAIDKTERKKYITRNGIIGLFFAGLGTGILMLSAGDVVLFIMQMYHRLMTFLGF